MAPIIADPIFYVLAIPAVIMLGLAKGGFSGVGTAATPLLAVYLPPLEAAALLLPVLICQDAMSVYVYRRDWSAWNLKVLLPGAAVGMVVGSLLASVVSDAVIRILVGGIGLAFVANMWLRHNPDKPHKATAAAGLFWGTISGFTSFLTQGGAPPFQVHTLPQRLPKMTFVGTSIMFFAGVNLMKIAPYFLLGQFTAKNFSTSLVLLPLAFAANFLGIYLVRRTPTEIFYRIAYALLLIISAVLVWQGGADLLRGVRVSLG